MPTVSRGKAKADNGTGRGGYAPEQWPFNSFTQVPPQNDFLKPLNPLKHVKTMSVFYWGECQWSRKGVGTCYTFNNKDKM